MKVLGVKIDRLGKVQVVERVREWVENGGFHLLVTIYSEFLVRAGRDDLFRKILNKADLGVVDGAGVAAAVEYVESKPGGVLGGLREGFKVGWRGLKGENGEVVTGVWLCERLVKEASRQGWKVFLLGGYGDRAEMLAGKFRDIYPSLQVKADGGEQRVGESEEVNERVIREINEYETDVLLVAYGSVVQEKWIWRNRKKLNVKVAIGVGGTFDELTGRVKRVPGWVERRGLKSFWRLMQEPKRWKRMVRAWMVFPWRVFRESL